MTVSYLPCLKDVREILQGGVVRPECTALLASGTQLIVPLSGGRKIRKSVSTERWEISEHGNWRHVHAGALNALYGRTPYWLHYSPMLLEIISNENIKNFGELTGRLFAEMMESIRVKELYGRLMPSHTAESVLGVKEEDASLSLVHYLFHYGPDTIFFLNPHSF